jgi:hypothetical protein
MIPPFPLMSMVFLFILPVASAPAKRYDSGSDFFLQPSHAKG